jgi:hypothetical protein
MAHMKTHNLQEQRSGQILAQRYKAIGIKAVAAAVRTEDKKVASQNRKQDARAVALQGTIPTRCARLGAESDIKVE